MTFDRLSSFWGSSRGKLAGLNVSLCVACVMMVVRTTKLPPAVCFFYRSVFTTFAFSCVGLFQVPNYFNVIRKNWALLGARSGFDALGGGLFFLSTAYFPLTELGFIVQTQTVFTIIVAFIILR